MRQLIYQTLLRQPLLTDPQDGKPPLVGQRLYQHGSLGHNGVPARPDFVFLLVFEQPAFANRVVQDTSSFRSQKRNFNIYAYDEEGAGYLRIEQVLWIVRDTLVMLTGRVSPSGARCTDVEWTGMSVDSRDPDYGANVKWATFSFQTQQ